MAKREFSSGLQGMKFMQRARARQEEAKKEEAKESVEDQWLTPLAQTSGRCSVISEGDPRPGALIGRMSFKNYNPSIEKLHEELEARRTEARKKVATNETRETPSEAEDRPTKRTKLDKAASSSEMAQAEQKQQATTTNQGSSGTKNQTSSGTKQTNRFDALQASRGFKKPPAL